MLKWSLCVKSKWFPREKLIMFDLSGVCKPTLCEVRMDGEVWTSNFVAWSDSKLKFTAFKSNYSPKLNH